MSDLENALAAHLNGKFFWEPSSTPSDTDAGGSIEIRRAQRKIAGKAKVIVTKDGRDKVKVEAIKAPKAVFRGPAKIVEPVIKAVSQVYDVSVDNLMARSTSIKYAAAKRHLYWCFYRYFPQISSSEYSRLIGKCRTSILHGKNEFELAYDAEKVKEVDEIMGWKE